MTTDWKPFATVPKDGCAVLAWTAGGDFMVVYYDDDGKKPPHFWTVPDTGLYYAESLFTHWDQPEGPAQ